MTKLIGKNKMLEMSSDIISKCDDAACEIVLMHNAHGLTRLANSTIHQNVHIEATSVTIRVSRGDRIGVSSTNSITPAGLFDCLINAMEIMKASEPLPGFPGPAEKADYKKTDTFCQATADWSPEDRAKVVLKAINRGKADKLTLAGAVESSVGEIAIANSNGVRAYQPLASFGCNFVAMDGEGDDPPSGYATLTGRDVSKANFEGTFDRACRKAVLARNPIEVEPGPYDVVLEAHAFCELVEWLNYIALGAKSVQDGISPFAGHLGDLVTGERITLVDDAYGNTIKGIPFDFEGVPRKKLTLIDHGVAKAVAYSRYAAARDEVEPTGHGFGPGAMPSDGIPINLRLEPGDKTLDEMVGMLDHGIQVTRFHYVNGLLDTRKAIMTGMTRDGAWLVEGGKIKHAIKNLRFTDSMLEAWKRVEAIEKTTHPVSAWWSGIGSYEIPGVLIRKFTFSGKTGKGS
jgi:predicted Zn-dependent protease